MRSTIVVSMLLVAFFSTETKGQSGLGAFAAGQAVSSVIDQIKDGANEVVHNTQNSVSRGAFDVRQNAEILLQQLGIIGKELEGKTFSDLNAAQKEFFNSTYATVQELKHSTAYTVAQADRLVARVDSMLGTLPGANRTARVLGFSPSYVPYRSGDQNVHVTINGTWLGTGEPALKLGNQNCIRNEKTESKLLFTCKTPQGLKINELTYSKMSLSTFDRQSFIDRIIGLFWNNRVERNYELGLAIVPEMMGSFSISATTSRDEYETRSRSEVRRSDNQHCQGTKDYNWTINADVGDGWSIAEKPTTRLESDSDASDEGVQSWTPTSFIFKGKAKNNGQCVKFLGEVVARDGRGHVQIRANWIERRPKKVKEDIVLPIEHVKWGEEKIVPLPEGTTFVSATGKMINGRSFQDTSIDSSPKPWYRMSFDMQNGNLVIRPRSLDEILSY